MVEQIGQLLIDNGYISQEQLDHALVQQSSARVRLGAILIGNGAITTYVLYQMLAKQKGVDFVNLQENPCDESFLEESQRDVYISLGLIPWQRGEDGIMRIACCDTSHSAHEYAKQRFGESYEFVITSPFDILWSVQKYFADIDDEEARESLFREMPQFSAKKLFKSNGGRNFALTMAAFAVAMLAYSPLLFAVLLVVQIFYSTSLAAKTMFIITGLWKERSNVLKDSQVDGHEYIRRRATSLQESELPVYTLLIPLYDEKAATLANITSAVRALDYPKSRLDVKLIIESDDGRTQNLLKDMRLESFFEIIRVPFSFPRTKPKACNYALRFARGEYVAIYDAEDVPDAAQLRKALAIFAHAQERGVKLGCVQSRLNFYNREEGILPGLFALEYGMWFDLMLPGLEKLGLPIPLGGTSNHFPIQVLREMRGWDPYNVTEDADLGIRLAASGYKTMINPSHTMEEAPLRLTSWIKQRTRWIKGYMQTFIVHTRSFSQMHERLSAHGMFGFMFFIGAPFVTFLSIPLVVLFSLFAWMKGASFPAWFLEFAIVNLVFSVALHIIAGAAIVMMKGWRGVSASLALFPVYWLLHIYASMRALMQLLTRPHYWEKTEHGISSVNPSNIGQT